VSVGSGAITFGGTVDGGFVLIADSTGTTTFAGALGGSTALVSLTTDAGGTTRLNGGSVRTSGAQTYGDPVTLGTTTVLTSTLGGNINFAQTLNGPGSLTTGTAGVSGFAAPVGASTALASLTVGALGTTQINGGSVRTTLNQTYNNPVALGTSTVITAGGGAFNGPVGGSAAVSFNLGGTFTLAGSNTYTGTTTLNSGTLTVNGAINAGGVAGAGNVLLNTAGVTLNGTGTIRGQVTVSHSTAASPTTLQRVSIIVPTGGTGITIPAGALSVLIGGAQGVTITGNATSTGVRVNAGSSARLLNNSITTNNVGVNVSGGTALLQGNNLSSNNLGSFATGLLVQGGAVVDAGQLSSAIPSYGNITGFGISNGGNAFHNYTASISSVNPNVPQAIRDLNTSAPSGTGPAYGNSGPQLGSYDLPAMGNLFDGTTLFAVEQVVFHDLDNPAFGFVDYGTVGGTTTPVKIIGPIAYYAQDVGEGTANNVVLGQVATGQKSIIRQIQMTFDGFVYIASGAFDLEKVNGPGTSGPVTLVPTASSYDPMTGHYTVTFAFAGAHVEPGGSLEDGNYSFKVISDKVQGGGPGGPGLDGNKDGIAQGSPTDDVFETFWRYYGDVTSTNAGNADRIVNDLDNHIFQSSYRSTVGMANYLYYLDYDNNGVIDATDYYQFLRRYRTKLNADGTISPSL
jgi:hypothetical protein